MADEPIPKGEYAVILADPPWQFATYSQRGKGRSAEAHYDCMSWTELAGLAEQVREAAAKDCVLLMWVTDPMLAWGLKLIDAWGFQYKTVGFYWAKANYGPRWNEEVEPPELENLPVTWPIGTGYWTRANPEQCLLATRGNPKRLNADVRKLIIAPRREHSRKPDEVYERIVHLCPGPYLELFARFQRPGWASWGNEDGVGLRRWRSDMGDG